MFVKIFMTLGREYHWACL